MKGWTEMASAKKRIIAFFFILLLVFPALPTPIIAASPFNDVKTTDPNYEAIEWAYQTGLTKGYPNGKFAPNDTITEAHFVSMLIRYDCSSPDSFPANSGEHKASGNYYYLQQTHFPLRGLTNTYLRDLPIQRGQVARMITTFRGLDLSEAQAIQYLYMNDLATGMTGKNDYQDFRPNASMTRGEAISLLHRLSKQNDCSLIGLNWNPNGRDNNKYELPIDFMGDRTVTFDSPEVNVTPPITVQPSDKRVVDVDIEKPTLIANGVDSTFVTISLKSCSSNNISYEDSLSFTAYSGAGAVISQPHDQVEDKYDEWANRYKYGRTVYTDGPDLTIKVTAPKSNTVRNDTISFTIDNKNNKNMDCYKQPITVQLTYVPQAELRVEAVPVNTTIDGVSQKRLNVTATIVLPGGDIIRNYNGRVQFRSAEGATLSNQYASFSNGVARTTVTPIQSSQPINDFISVTIDQMDNRYTRDLQSIVNANHRLEVLYDSPLRLNESCVVELPEVAFILDSSGSMLRNDPERLRVTKSEEFITALNAPQNISVRFSSSGVLLSGPAAMPPVKATFSKVGQSGGTNIGDGLEKAFNAYKSSGPKVAILLTDGKSNEQKIEKMLERAKKENIKIFTIGLGNHKHLNEDLLRRLASETGGNYYHIEENIDIGTAYQSIFTAITCGIPMPSCTNLSQAFSEPMLEIKSTQFYMHTFVRQGCGDIERVVLRLKSAEGDIDYDLVSRGQRYFALKKGINEISNFELYEEGIFLAYDRAGKLVGEKLIKMTH